MKAALMGMLGSKKALATLAGIVFYVLDEMLGLEVPGDLKTQILALLGMYVVGQGIADIGKERAKVDKDG